MSDVARLASLLRRPGRLARIAAAVAALAHPGCAPKGPPPRSSASPAGPCAAPPSWRFLFANGGNGEDVAGDRASLLAAVRRGSPLRVGWSEANAKEGWAVEEFSGVGFINIMGKRDLVVQLENALIQTNYVNAARAGLRAPAVEWHALMSTDGRFEALMVERETGKTVRKLVQRTRMSWYALAPPPSCDDRPAVLREGDHQNEKVEDKRFDAPGEAPR